MIRLMHSSESRTKHRPQQLRALWIENSVESIALEKEIVKDLVAVLLIDVSSLVLYNIKLIAYYILICPEHRV